MSNSPGDFLHFHRAWLGPEEEEEIISTLRSSWLTTGPRTKRFEQEFARFAKAKYAVAVTSCTAAMHLALTALEIGPGDEVITSPMTFASTANVIVHRGATPVFVDAEPGTLNIDPNKIEERITRKTRAIMPVHFAGRPCEMNAIMRIARRHKLAVIEDAAHALESEYKGRKIGSISDATAFSFYATKNITTGEGGMVTTNRKSLAEKMQVLSLHGLSKDAWKRYSESGFAHYDVIYPGYKYNMFDIQAALGLCQLAKIDDFWKRRKNYTEIYDQAFKEVPEIIPLVKEGDIKHAYHLYVILVKTEELTVSRDVILKEIQAKGIGVGVHFRALHLHPFYRKTFGFRRGQFPVAEYASDRVISLPLYPKMEEWDVNKVINTVKKIIRGARGSQGKNKSLSAQRPFHLRD